jgi:hypothetical protein
VPFDDNKFYAPALRHEVAAVAIQVSLAIGDIAFALDALRDGNPSELKSRIVTVRERATRLEEMFNELTGYTES